VDSFGSAECLGITKKAENFAWFHIFRRQTLVNTQVNTKRVFTWWCLRSPSSDVSWNYCSLFASAFTCYSVQNRILLHRWTR